MGRWIKLITATIALTAVFVATTQAQITTPRKLSASSDRFANLQEQLINRLRATTEDKQAYIRRLIKLVRAKKLEVKLIVAIERKAIEQRPRFPFPYFEKAVKVEAAKRRVNVPTVVEFEAARTRVRR